ncbi:DUF1849 domain-containing protein [Azospirillaceae bacterium]
MVATLINCSFLGRLAAFVITSAVIACASFSTAQAVVEITPHRAVYKMSLSSARRNSPVVGVQGKMLFQWGDACDGWTIEQHFRLNFAYAEGEVMQMRSSSVTWESKDGRRYRFNIRKLVNGELDEEFQGDATLPDGGKNGSARFVEPESNEIPLVAGTLFPTAHTLALLERARAGDVLFSRTVFDGSDAENATEINAVIGGRLKKPPTLPNAAAELAGQEAWPIRLAFFPLKNAKEQPEYEMSMILLDSGVAQSMHIDYGDFSADALLESLEPLPRPGC